MKKQSGNPRPKAGERTALTCPVCSDAVLKQETFGRGGALNGHRLVCSKRGCPWQGSSRQAQAAR
jgi:hypothetical protein